MRLLLILLCASITCGIVVEYDFEARQTVCKPDGFPRSCLGFFLKDSPSGTAPFPGPLVKARVGDTLRVHVRNFLHEEIVSVHWHGLHMRFNAWQDGTPFITDCGIRPGATRVYEFLVEQAGTYFYHSHTCAQYTDGLLGPIVIESDDDKVKFGYKEEHVLMLQDWQHESRKDLMAAMSPFGAFAGFKPFYPFPPVSLLLNGHVLQKEKKIVSFSEKKFFF
jgi:iron transport multicopper oxidase